VSKKESERAPQDAIKVRLRVQRQDGPSKPETKRYEQFEVELPRNGTVCTALFALEEQCGEHGSAGKGSPVAFEWGCLEGACGSCTMRINGRVEQACAMPIAEAARSGTVTLEPLSKFPVVRDLVVDRTRLFRGLDETARSDGETTTDMHGHTPEHRASLDALSRCINCGACLEACPEVHKGGPFVGAAQLHHLERAHRMAPDETERRRLVDLAIGEGGVADCGKAQNCVEVCPVELPLVDSIQRLSRAATQRVLFGWWSR
jgi:succinate dehydrogenase / fumarate reductase, iron-sulfur subunit